MKVIFLDVDGVLNSSDFFMKEYNLWKKDKSYNRTYLDENNISLLKEIVDLTDANIVLSSTWRIDFDDKMKPIHKDRHAANLIKALDKYGLSLYDKTSFLGTKRGNEIRKWLDEHEGITDFVILDDDRDMEEFTDTNLIQTDFYKGGLLKEHVNKAIDMLKPNTKKKMR